MNADDHDFPGEDTLYDQDKFERIFSKAAKRLKLDTRLTHTELGLLRQAFFQAFLCNVAFNGFAGSPEKARPEHEPHRIMLEQTFMGSRDCLYASRGWQRLPVRLRQRINRTLLHVEVTDDNLAN